MSTSFCGTIGANTGSIGCDPVRSNPQKLMLGTSSYDSTDYADSDSLLAAMTADVILGTGSSSKLYPFPVIQGTTDQTEAAKYGTLGYGFKEKLLRSKPAYEFDVKVGSSLEKKLIAFDGQTIPVFVMDDKNQIWGKFDKNLNYIGCDCLVGVEPRGFGDAQNSKTTKITISYVDTTDFVENAAVFEANFTSGDINGLKDAVGFEIIAHTSNVYKIGYKIASSVVGKILNIYDEAGAALAALVANFSAKTGAGFATTLAITSIAVDATNKCLTVTFDSTAYTALAALSKIKFIPPTPIQLDGGSVTGFELATLIVSK